MVVNLDPGKIIPTVYVDDMLVKSKACPRHADDLEECFEVVRRYRMKLNPKKCTFGVKSGKFLGFIVSQRGIEANPRKILLGFMP